MKTVDLPSDTVTQPTPAMRQAMAAAPVGDDVFGDDPSVRALQDRMAALTGKEAALFMPSGTQSNWCALMAHCERGDEDLVGQNAHTYRYEGGGAAVLGSIQPQPLAQDAQGQMALVDITGAIKPLDAHFARTRLLCLENTWNGHFMPMPYLEQATALARQHGLATHLDGARVMNAAVAQAQAEGTDAMTELCRIAGLFDSVSVCLSKGLGAPVGSVLCGSAALMDKAHRWRKVLGGGMRQSGLLAAAALHALEHHVLQGLPGISVRSAQTNIVFVDVANGLAPELLAHLSQDGVLATGMVRPRFVTHLDVDAAGIDQALASVRRFAVTHAHALSASV